jgi:glyceraldehyde 3-phosphate dehydrogenase
VSRNKPLKLGLMGFGQTGRQLYDLAVESDDIEIVAIADIGDPRILHYLLQAEVAEGERYTLEGNFLHNARFDSRLMAIDTPREMPWDVLGVDMVVDATDKFRQATAMQDHLRNGANRVLIRSLPVDEIDQILIPGVNDEAASASDRMISAGSATTTALCLLLKILSAKYEIECASLTTVHAYTSDQALQDYAGSDYRRSRSAAENIIPNSHEAANWLSHILPEFDGKVLTSTLNVPIHEGCLADVNIVFKDESITADTVNDTMRDAVAAHPGIVGVVEDPIVSSDVIGSSLSLLFDVKGTIKAGDSIIKTLSWYENRGHAARLLDVARIYGQLGTAEEAA